MNSRWARFARGWTAAGFATFVAAFSHTLSGGATPSMFGVLVSLMISGAMCTMLTGRGLSLWRLTASVALSQLLFHSVFSGLGTPAALGEHSMTAMPMDAAGMDVASTHAHAAPTMWLAHAVAALVTVVAFRYAERAFWGVADTARLLLARLLAVVIPVVVTRRRTTISVDRQFVPRDLSLLLSLMRHRGPPVEHWAV